VYYGYAPPTIMNWTTTEDDVRMDNYTALPARLDIIGINDSTAIEVIDLSNEDIISSASLDRMDVHTVYLGTRVSSTTEPDVEGTYFKVVADKMVAVLLSGGSPQNYDEIYRSTYYPSTDGAYSGKEFIFKAVNGTWEPVIYVWEWNIVIIFGVEPAHVIVYDDAGNKLHEFDVPANSYGRITLISGEVYRVVSTGRIMLASICRECFAIAPSATGGFIGKYFYGMMTGARPGTDVWVGSYQSFVVVAQEDCEVSVYSLLKPELQRGLGPDLARTLEAGEVFFDTSFDQQTPLRIDSTGDIIVLFGRGGYAWGTTNTRAVMYPENVGDDVSCIAVEADREVSFFAPTGAVIFAPQNLDIVIDGALISMKSDEYMVLMGGSHIIQSSAPVIVEVLSDSNTLQTAEGGYVENRFDSWATYLTPTQTLEVTYPPPPPAGSLAELYTYVGAGVSAAVIAVVALLLLRRRKTAR